MTLSFSPLSLAEAHRRRAMQRTECVDLVDVEVDVDLVDEAEAN